MLVKFKNNKIEDVIFAKRENTELDENYYEYDGELKDVFYLKLENGELVIDEELKASDKLKKEREEEIETLEKWFADYDRKVSEHNRCLRLNIPCHHDIATLDSEAVVNAERLKELREGVNNEI